MMRKSEDEWWESFRRQVVSGDKLIFKLMRILSPSAARLHNWGRKMSKTLLILCAITTRMLKNILQIDCIFCRQTAHGKRFNVCEFGLFAYDFHDVFRFHHFMQLFQNY